MLFLFLSAVLARTAFASEQITVEFLYWNPINDPRFCSTCPSWNALYDDFLTKNTKIARIAKDFDGRVIFEWIDITSADGSFEKQKYNVNSPNSLVINGTIKIEGSFNETQIKEQINSILTGSSPPNQASNDLLPLVALALSFGFLEALSPCLIGLLSFVLSYTLGKTRRTMDNFLKVMMFGAGFVIAAISIGLVFSIMYSSLQEYQIALAWITCVFALFLGLGLVGVIKIPLEAKTLLQKLTGIRFHSLGGLILLGFLFYFIDPCMAPIFFATLPVVSPAALSLLLAFFCAGLIVPFLVIGILAGSIPKLAKVTGKYKSKIRAASGLLLIAYVLYVIFFHLV
jgi:cytochrome c biogenesis protein CcdA